MAVGGEPKAEGGEREPLGVFRPRGDAQRGRGSDRHCGSTKKAGSVLSAPFTRTRTANFACSWSSATVGSSLGAALKAMGAAAAGVTSRWGSLVGPGAPASSQEAAAGVSHARRARVEAGR